MNGEHFTWRSLWGGAQILQERGRADETGNWWLTLSAMLLAFAALEAYLNYLGPELCPIEWKDERARFASGRFRGTLGKLAFLLRRCGITLDRGKKPWQTLKDLNRRRDKLVHPRSESWDREIRFTDTSELDAVDAEFWSIADERFVDEAMAAIEAICDPLHIAARKLLGETPGLAGSAFVGMIGHRGGSILEMH